MRVLHNIMLDFFSTSRKRVETTKQMKMKDPLGSIYPGGQEDLQQEALPFCKASRRTQGAMKTHRKALYEFPTPINQNQAERNRSS
jgi:hypothetical protein